MSGNRSYWDTYPDVKRLVMGMWAPDTERDDPPYTYQQIRNAIHAAYPEVPLPSYSQIYRLKKEAGSVDPGRGPAGPGGRKNLPETAPEIREYALELAKNRVSQTKIRTKIAEKFGFLPSNWQVRTLLGYRKAGKTLVVRAAGEERVASSSSSVPSESTAHTGQTGPDHTTTGNNRQESTITGNNKQQPVCSQGLPPVYVRPYTPVKSPIGIPISVRDGFVGDLLELPDLPAAVKAMLTHDLAEGCLSPGIIRQSKIGCLKRQVTAGHPRYVRPLSGSGTALNLFYIRCSRCTNFISDDDYHAVIQGLRGAWRKRAARRAKRVA